MYKFIKITLLSFFFFFILSLVTQNKLHAESTLFSENFDSYSNNSFPSGWSTSGYTNWKVLDGMFGVQPSNDVSNAYPTLWESTWNDYVFETDIKRVSGSDGNVAFRYLGPDDFYEIHYSGSMWYFARHTFGVSPNFRPASPVPFSLEKNRIYHVKITAQGNHFLIEVDGNTLFDAYDNDNPILTGRPALRVANNIEFWYDNIEVKTIEPDPTNSPTATPVVTPTPTVTPSPTPTNSPAPSPTPSPTASPTISPTPSPTFISLSVPDLKQFSLPWGEKLYDHTRSNIEELGCALTSASMILQYHGAESANPDELNEWLNNQPDGYLRNGLVNWLAVSRFTYPHLEYLRLLPTDENIINELVNTRPSIVKVPGHFVVIKGQTQNSFEINDPGYSENNDLDVYPDRISLNTFTPSYTDLSYMMFVGDEDLVFELTDGSENVISSQNFIEEPINYLNSPDNKYGKPLSILLYPKPENGNYKLRVKGDPGHYRLDSYLYDKEGKLNKQTFTGEIKDNESDIYPVSINLKRAKLTIYQQFIKNYELKFNVYKKAQEIIKRYIKIFFFFRNTVRK